MSPKRVAKAMGLFGAAALAVVLAVAIYVVRHRAPATTMQQMADLVPSALLHAHNLKWTQMSGAQSQWHLSAREASYSHDKTSLVLTDAELSMVSKDGKNVKVSAPRAEISVTGNHINQAHLSGGLRINYGDFELKTAEATFSPDKDVVNAPGQVEVQGQGMTVTGVGLTGHPNERNFTLLSQTNTVVIPKKSSDLKSGKS
ncbi:MAG TPA: LPS export ABC transporter periplasmic protein LptC [Candidatus Binataceae bacterium]|jgi:LPS export ABC transporter protein LptC|nr:LPS export ABC transporter periplasmic protein LptC [Candidatus Binataceae bacterium]